MVSAAGRDVESSGRPSSVTDRPPERGVRRRPTASLATHTQLPPVCVGDRVGFQSANAATRSGLGDRLGLGGALQPVGAVGCRHARGLGRGHLDRCRARRYRRVLHRGPGDVRQGSGASSTTRPRRSSGPGTNGSPELPVVRPPPGCPWAPARPTAVPGRQRRAAGCEAGS